MAAESRYIISFIVDNQPQSRVVTHESETLPSRTIARPIHVQPAAAERHGNSDGSVSNLPEFR
jgi:hypothetical protein